MEMLTKLLSAGITRRRVCNIIDPRRVKLGIDISQGIGSNLRAPAEERARAIRHLCAHRMLPFHRIELCAIRWDHLEIRWTACCFLSGLLCDKQPGSFGISCFWKGQSVFVGPSSPYRRLSYLSSCSSRYTQTLSIKNGITATRSFNFVSDPQIFDSSLI